jgi:hypothetical protein
MEKSDEEKTLRIFYPSLRFDIDTPLQVADCWENEEVEIYTVVDFDPTHGKEDIKPIGMPMCLEKVQKHIKKYITEKFNVHIFEEPSGDNHQIEVGGSSSDEGSESSYDEDCWTLRWKMNERSYTLYYYFGFDPFGEYWPEKIDDISSFIHTSGPIDLEDEESDIVELLKERCNDADVYASFEMATKFWPDAEEYYEFADDSDVDEKDTDALYYLGAIKPYLNYVADDSSD